MHEINLLPPARRQSLRSEVALLSFARFLSTLIVALGTLSGAGLLVAAVLWIFGLTTTGAASDELKQNIAAYQQLRDTIAAQSVFVTTVHTLSQERIVWADFLEKFFAVVPPGVEITAMGGTLDLAGSHLRDVHFSVSGQAVARSTLTVFQDRLQSLPQVQAVEAPSSNLILRDNPLYRFTLTLRDPAAP